jgi:hypothetical protein
MDQSHQKMLQLPPGDPRALAVFVVRPQEVTQHGKFFKPHFFPQNNTATN